MAVRMDTIASIYKYRDDQGLQHFIAELYADETSDISGVTTFGTIVAEPTSTAYVIKAGKLYVMASDKKWYDESGNEVN